MTLSGMLQGKAPVLRAKRHLGAISPTRMEPRVQTADEATSKHSITIPRRVVPRTNQIKPGQGTQASVKLQKCGAWNVIKPTHWTLLEKSRRLQSARIPAPMMCTCSGVSASHRRVPSIAQEVMLATSHYSCPHVAVFPSGYPLTTSGTYEPEACFRSSTTIPWYPVNIAVSGGPGYSKRKPLHLKLLKLIFTGAPGGKFNAAPLFSAVELHGFGNQQWHLNHQLWCASFITDSFTL